MEGTAAKKRRNPPRRVARMSVEELTAAYAQKEAMREAELAKVNARYDKWKIKYETELKKREQKYAEDALAGAVKRVIAEGKAANRVDALRVLAEMA